MAASDDAAGCLGALLIPALIVAWTALHFSSVAILFSRDTRPAGKAAYGLPGYGESERDAFFCPRYLRVGQ